MKSTRRGWLLAMDGGQRARSQMPESFCSVTGASAKALAVRAS